MQMGSGPGGAGGATWALRGHPVFNELLMAPHWSCLAHVRSNVNVSVNENVDVHVNTPCVGVLWPMSIWACHVG